MKYIKIYRTQTKNNEAYLNREQKNKKLPEDFFKKHIKNKLPLKKHECETLRNQYPKFFANKVWLIIKVVVQNIYKKI